MFVYIHIYIYIHIHKTCSLYISNAPQLLNISCRSAHAKQADADSLQLFYISFPSTHAGLKTTESGGFKGRTDPVVLTSVTRHCHSALPFPQHMHAEQPEADSPCLFYVSFPSFASTPKTLHQQSNRGADWKAGLRGTGEESISHRHQIAAWYMTH